MKLVYNWQKKKKKYITIYLYLSKRVASKQLLIKQQWDSVTRIRLIINV